MKYIYRILIAVILVAFGFILGYNSSGILKTFGYFGGADANSVYFSGRTINFNGDTFSGTNLNAVFGGLKCDLRDAVVENDCTIQVNVVFGGIEIYLPNDVNVKVDVNTSFGGVSDKTGRDYNQNAPTVYIQGSCVFGGVNIK